MTVPPVDTDFAFSPQDPAKAKDFALMDRIRAARPVCRPAENLVLTTRWRDTRDAFRDIARYSSVGDMRAPGVTVPVEESFLGELDAPLHPRIRRILMRGFTLKAGGAAEPWTRANVRRRLERFAQAGGGDLMTALAIPLPGSVSAHAMGVPDELHDQAMAWCNELLHSTWPSHGRTERGDGIAGAFPEFAAMLDALIAEREVAGPGGADDLLATMVHARDEDGWRIGAHHVRTLMVNILSGSLSASYMLGNLAYRFVADEAFQQSLRDDPALIPAAVEESLRFEPPVAFLFRTAREDGAIGGCPVHKGEHLMLGIHAANRDPDVFDDPGSFRLDRSNGDAHLSFGFGAHLCTGNHLTRMIGRVVLEELIARFPPGGLALAPGFEWRCVAHHLEYGPETLDLVVR
ncbi:cytochrome P450 [Sphingomonas jatrophae]|uniref:Cytochrome P450 n=1 Tax=Sphingomonas jatrophae TaxID=1166337 RepID=A0A1I6KGH6_9SPHN|nr:cytochrome P450 [Sphingomonas jatrophae]SFR90323.1 Cytochrome P450 [Sphingomonas jatrophae]